MKHVKTIIYIIPILLISTSVLAQFELDGTVDLKPYFGYQGDLIQGVSNEPAFEKPVVRHVYLVKPDIIGLTIDALSADKTGVRYYDPHPADSIIVTDGNKIPEHLFEEAGNEEFVTKEQRETGHTGHFTFIYRNGQKYGWLVGPGRNMYLPVESMHGKRMDTDWADSREAYTISSSDDLSFSDGVQPHQVFRKTKPHYRSFEGPEWGGSRGERHEIYLHLPNEIEPGREYTITFQGNELETPSIHFRFYDKEMRTEIIHVNQSGYHPLQPKKAYLSCWMGSGGPVSYDGITNFFIIDNFSGEEVFKGKVEKVLNHDEPEINTERSGPLNFSKTDVYELDFPELKKQGQYKIYLPGIGVSFPFNIAKDTWEKSFRIQMMGFLHQRSGLELGAPYTTYSRPRNFHPEDHFNIRACDADGFFPEEGPERMQHQIFESIKRSIVPDSNNPDAWGGWADAADYDRRFSHFAAVLNMIDLLHYNPDYFEKLELNIPETDNNIPDILDEALWCTELWRRTQKENGEISIGVESIVHPRREPSWLDGLPVALMPGTPDAAANYIITAAQLAEMLKKYNSTLAEKYEVSALKALNWLEENGENPKFKRFQTNIHEKAAACMSLYHLTGKDKFHQKGLKLMQEGFDDKFSGLNFNNGRAVFIYAFLDEDVTDKRVRQQCRNAIIRVANDLTEGANETAYRVIRPTNDTYRNWIIETNNSQLLILAHQLTHDKKYIDALVNTCQFGMGANPLNLSYTSGLGVRFIYPYHGDSRFGNVGVPSGIAAYGPYYLNPNDLPENSWGWDKTDVEDFKNQLYPHNALDWPWFETYFRHIGWPAINEFTVHQGMRDQMLRWGYLAQFYETEKTSIPRKKRIQNNK